MPKYSIILPTYNERENLPVIVYLIFEMAKKNNLDFEVIIVEDNSPDGTGEIAKKLESVYAGKIKTLNRTGKLGLGRINILFRECLHRRSENDYWRLRGADGRRPQSPSQVSPPFHPRTEED
jgi:glycosyltransferase involved in cell wall biosynthesis